ncbi:hypothetical protein Fa020709_156 [Synechococcus phage S-RIM2]|uniref:Uncharacterized protein n=1 Tax=Synechococcus phage S-RIM2 TaxID=687800 RepID=A0A1D7RT02_9CAUD|nr:hypothetical protein Fa020709_156 [Synechococcus phage S-RIM2]AON97883.1 hypothetical protein Fa100709_156 [Synechococcus phage S-RIM2]AON99813.1 hypothetical protein NJ_05_1013_155 [Synechococcus phage S-RIM2]AOO01097.1 hypothetical protein Np060912_156 [Synechococcus phage S-RIM2]AOO01525.1 hypothetical protein Np120912_156 [Synechococcus phage S-RIM2]
MNLFNSNKEQPSDYFPEPKKEKPSKFKIVVATVGALFAVSHVGLLGYVIHQPRRSDVPVINIPRGDYSSYRIKAGRDGYEIEYKANDPAILRSERSLQVDKDKRGWFGPTTEKRREYRTDEYTMDGTRNLGGAAVDSEGKSLAKSEECIRADAGARSQGAMAGSAIAAGVAVPAVVGIPYIGWLAGGWALLLGQKAGSEIGAEVGSVFNDC